MKNIFRWEQLNKLAVIFSIIGGVYLLYQFFNLLFSEKNNIKSEISINKFIIPLEKDKFSYWKDLEQIIPDQLDSSYRSRIKNDSLNNLDIIDLYKFSNFEQKIKAILKERERHYLIKKIDSIIGEATYPMRLTNYYIKSSIKNNGKSIARELRFELPANGYYELYRKDRLVRKGDFQDFIIMDGLRPYGSATLLIWSFSEISDDDLKYTNRIKYTYDGGIIIPSLLKPIRTKGFFYWVYENPIGAIYFLVWLPIYLTYVITRKLRI